MILMFNKQYRQESALISDLAKKIKKSKSIIRVCHENTEIYELDNIEVCFDILKSVLSVIIKSGSKLVSLDCSYADDELQLARYHMFSNLLQRARDTYYRSIDKAKALEQATKEAKKKQEALDKAKAEKEAVEAKIIDARRRIKSL